MRHGMLAHTQRGARIAAAPRIVRLTQAALVAVAAAATFALAGCVSIGSEPVALQQLRLLDAGVAAVSPRATPLVPTLLVQPQPADAIADTLSIAYTRAPQSFAFYQHASWTERPVRRLTRLLQERLQKRGVAAAVGQLGDPLSSEWLLALRVETLHHDASSSPGQAHVDLVAELFDRRSRQRVAQQRFAASAPVASSNSVAANAAMSVAVGHAFDQLVPWLETVLAPRAAQ